MNRNAAAARNRQKYLDDQAAARRAHVVTTAAQAAATREQFAKVSLATTLAMTEAYALRRRINGQMAQGIGTSDPTPEQAAVVAAVNALRDANAQLDAAMMALHAALPADPA